jgi:FMN phosphatase YigB (HAD superfamily)
MIIGVDIDGVIVDFDRGWVERWNSTHEHQVQVGAPQMWQWMHRLAGLPDAETWWEWFETTGGFWKLPYYEGALRALHYIAGQERVMLISSRPPYGRDPVYEMINRHGLGDVLEGVLFLEDKGEAPIYSLVEDRPDTLLNAMHTFDVVRVERPWNQVEDYPELEGIQTVSSLMEYWEQFVAHGLTR